MDLGENTEIEAKRQHARAVQIIFFNLVNFTVEAGKPRLIKGPTT